MEIPSEQPEKGQLPPEWAEEDPTLSLNWERASLMLTVAPIPTDSGGGTYLPEGTAFPLGRLLGRGGHGEVWEGHQSSLARVVAVKRIRPEMLDAAVDPTKAALIQQFHAEALITARLEHPNIVPVHELRADEQGRPLLAMKLVRGTSWSAQLRRQFEELPSSEVVAANIPILIQVCHAVAFAHERGIVHRDLKPAQVMLGQHGEVVLMDWGLAFLMGTQAPAIPNMPTMAVDLPTQGSTKNPSGTPAYMAPEQTMPTTAVLGYWTDVYLLGAILYEILTGNPPHHAKISGVAFAMAQQGAPPPPRLRTPERDIPAELEAICQRAMSFKPEDRHRSVEEFLKALHDYQNGTTRRNESMAIVERLRKSLPTVGGDYRSLSEITAELTRALLLWPENREAMALGDDAHERFARAAIGQSDLQLARVEAERISTPRRATEVLADVETAQRSIRRSARQRTAALIGCGVLAVALVGTGYTHIQQQTAARLKLEAANAALARAVAESNANRVAAEDLLAFMLGDLRPRLEPIGQLPLLADVGDRALRYFDRQNLEELSDDGLRSKALAFTQIARVQQGQGKLAEAESTALLSIDKIAPLAEQNPSAATMATLAGAYQTLGSVYHFSGRLPEGFSSYQTAVIWYRKALATEGNNAIWRGELAETISSLGDVSLGKGELDAGLSYFNEALAIFTELRRLEPDNILWGKAHATTVGLIGYTYRLQGKLPEAQTLLQESVDELSSTLKLAPGNILWRKDLTFIQDRLGGVLLASGMQQEALRVYLENVVSLRMMVDHDPSNVEWRLRLAVGLNRMGVIHEQLMEPHEAKILFNESLALARVIQEQDPINSGATTHVGWTLKLIAKNALTLGDHQTAERSTEEAILLHEGQLSKDPNSRWWQSDLAQGFALRGELALRREDFSSAIAETDKALATWGSLIEADPDNEYWRNSRGRGLWVTARAKRLSGDSDAAQVILQEAITLIQPMAEKSQDSTHLATLAKLLLEAGRHEEAAPLLQTLHQRGFYDPFLDNNLSD